MIRIVIMNNVDKENVLVMIQIMKICGGNDLDSENVWR